MGKSGKEKKVKVVKFRSAGERWDYARGQVQILRTALAEAAQEERAAWEALIQTKAQIITTLRPRELQVLGELVAHPELRTKELAQKLFVSERAVKWHITRILQRLGAKNRREILGLVMKGKLAEVIGVEKEFKEGTEKWRQLAEDSFGKQSVQQRG